MRSCAPGEHHQSRLQNGFIYVTYLIRGEAVVQLHDADLAPVPAADPRRLEGPVGGALRHAEADDLHGTLALKRCRGVGGHALCDDLDALVLERVRVNELLRGDDAARR